MEEPVSFTLDNKNLYGILHKPAEAGPGVVVIMVVGGPEARYGSHRLYVRLARFLCDRGITVLRFDYEGMGDSEGEFVGWRHAEPSIGAAVDFMSERFPDSKKYIWALCDGSSASVIYVNKNPDRIAGLVLCNPFVLSEEGRARTNLKHYYTKRILEKEFWLKLLCFRVNFKKTIATLIKTLGKANLFAGKKKLSAKDFTENLDISLPAIAVEGMIAYGRPVRCILSTDDLRAKQFHDTLMARKGIDKYIRENKINLHIVKGADHTFTDPEKKKHLFEVTLRYLNELDD